MCTEKVEANELYIYLHSVAVYIIMSSAFLLASGEAGKSSEVIITEERV